MPNNVIYRTPNSVLSSEDSAYNSMGGHYDTRPPRPNSIELRRSYPAETVDGYVPLSPHYQQSTYPPAYDENIYNSQHLYGPGGQAPSSENIYSPGTPSRTKPRPSQPPPAPPSSGSGGATPNASNANTPTRGRRMSTGRDALPPPPPVPEGMMSPQHHMNGGVVAAKLLARSHSTSRAGSPQLGPGGQHDPNALVMAQLNNQINNLNNINMQMTQMNSLSDLPPPPPIPEHVSLCAGCVCVCASFVNLYVVLQLSPKQSPPNAAPPPPPPPPPLEGPQSPPSLYKPLANGDINNSMITPSKKVLAKKVLPPVDDTRNDLLKAIRDGNLFNQSVYSVLSEFVFHFHLFNRHQTAKS